MLLRRESRSVRCVQQRLTTRMRSEILVMSRLALRWVGDASASAAVGGLGSDGESSSRSCMFSNVCVNPVRRASSRERLIACCGCRRLVAGLRSAAARLQGPPASVRECGGEGLAVNCGEQSGGQDQEVQMQRPMRIEV